MLRKLFMAMFVLMLPVIALGQISELGKPVKNVADADIVGSVTWHNDTVYVMNGFVYVENGEQLTIEQGTIIKGQPGSGAAATALIVARGGKIIANGTAAEPIIFTAVSDNLDDPNDIPSGAPGKGLWGSVIILGKARLNTAAGTAQIEGIPDTEPRANYGGTDDNDNSGTFRYVSLRHGGSIIGAANEINGLTMGGVGRGTTIDHVEVYQNLDDGFEFFGGTVNTKYLANVFCDDDGFDTDFGFTGEGQYWFSIKDGGVQSGSRTFEWDACTSPATPATPAILTRPIVSNVTGIGAGRTVANNDFAIALRTGAGGFIYNSIFTEQSGKAIQSATAATDALLGTDLKFINNVFNNFNAANTTTLSLVTSAAAASFVTHLDANNDMFVNPGLRGISRTVGSLALDPRPMGPTATGGQVVPGADDPQSWIDDVTYQGAFDPNATNWMCEWTASSFYSLLTPCAELAACDCISDSLNGALKPVKVFSDADMVGQVVLRADTVWNLNGFVYVENNEGLIIEPGTVIKGNPGSGAAATALIVARGGKIYAQGTPNCPIVMTAISDNVDDVNDIPLGAPGKGLWGSLLMLGKARLNTAAGTAQIEGIPDTEPRGNYGGTDDNDNSGILQYVSLRHGGSIIGAANEINGLTLGGVGRGTTIDHIEVYQNLDDGFEFFGGTVNTKYLVNAFCDDDGFDTDFGFSGEGQYWFSIKDAGVQSGSRTFEWDNCTSPATPSTPAIQTRPIVSNVTGIGAGKGVANNDFAIALRTGAGGFIYNSIFTDMGGKAVQSNTAATDLRLNTDTLKFINNVFWGFKNFAVTDSLITTNVAGNKPAWVTYFNNNNDMFVNPHIRSISRAQDGKLDPRPSTNYAAATGGQAVPGADDPQSYIDDVAYQGAFDPNVSLANSWLGWTFLNCGGHLGEQADPSACACTDNSKPEKVFTDASMVGNYVMSNDTVYNLSGFVYVENGEVLRIEPGTILKGNPGSGAAATALIVARGGKAIMEGSSNCPIIMTAISDDIDDVNDIPLGAPGKGLWGSLIVLGKARLNTAAGTAQIEGIPDTEPRGNYGGTDDNDNSGIYRYISLRHGGSIIGAANEINGLTMGGVGRGTTIDHIEVYQNLDDGFEFFGGTVNTKYLVNAFCDDDGFDTDFGFRGEGQFWFSIKDAGVQSGSRTFEWDACTSPATPATPAILTRPVVSNVTGIGSGTAVTNNDYAIALRTGSGGLIYNSIFTDMGGRAIQSTTATTDGLLGTDLKFAKNIFYGFPAAYTATDSLVTSAARPAFVTHLNTNNDMLLNPFIRGINRTQSGLLDPRPCPTGIGASGAVAVPATEDSASWMATTTYRGAFDPTVPLAASWLGGCWSFLTAGNHLGEVAAPVSCSPVVSCCIGTTGNVNKSVAEAPDLSDLSLLIAYLTQTPKPTLPCLAEANVNASPAVNPDLSDLSLLIAFLTQTPKPTLPTCP